MLRRLEKVLTFRNLCSIRYTHYVSHLLEKHICTRTQPQSNNAEHRFSDYPELNETDRFPDSVTEADFSTHIDTKLPSLLRQPFLLTKVSILKEIPGSEVTGLRVLTRG